MIISPKKMSFSTNHLSLLAVAVLVLVGLISLVESRRDSTMDDLLGGPDKRRALQQRDLIQDVVSCTIELIKNILGGKIQIPRPCCSLPILNFFCNPSRRADLMKLQISD